MPHLEIACFNVQSALVAHEAGADRIELCAGADVGGTTPDWDILSTVVAAVRPEGHFQNRRQNQTKIPVFVMNRPRGGDFVYSDAEFEGMKSDMEKMHTLADGFVFGILDAQGNVDVRRNQELVRLAHGRPCTFHRAFDQCRNLLRALEDITHCGFTTVLTSGGRNAALDGARDIADLVTKAQDRVVIMPGGGVRSSNIAALINETEAAWYHSSAITSANDVASFEEIHRLKALLHDHDKPSDL